VFFRSVDTPHGLEFYVLTLRPSGITLGRRTHMPGQEASQQDLASAAGVLQPRQWYEVAIRAIGGQIDVAIDKQPVLSYQDSAPLTSGGCGLGVILGSGAVLYDDVVLTALATVGSTSETRYAAGTGNWP